MIIGYIRVPLERLVRTNAIVRLCPLSTPPASLIVPETDGAGERPDRRYVDDLFG